MGRSRLWPADVLACKQNPGERLGGVRPLGMPRISRTTRLPAPLLRRRGSGAGFVSPCLPAAKPKPGSCGARNEGLALYGSGTVGIVWL